MRIAKIKLPSKETEDNVVQFFVQGEKKLDKITVESGDEPAGSFKDAMAALADDVCSICELDKKEVANLRVHTVSFSYHGESDAQAAVISGHRKLKNSPSGMNINTPMKYVEALHEKQPKSMLFSEDAMERIQTLIDEAFKYAKSNRAQQELALNSD